MAESIKLQFKCAVFQTSFNGNSSYLKPLQFVYLQPVFPESFKQHCVPWKGMSICERETGQGRRRGRRRNSGPNVVYTSRKRWPRNPPSPSWTQTTLQCRPWHSKEKLPGVSKSDSAVNKKRTKTLEEIDRYTLCSNQIVLWCVYRHRRIPH